MIENNNLYITPEQAKKWAEDHKYDSVIYKDNDFKKEVLKKLDKIISLLELKS